MFNFLKNHPFGVEAFFESSLVLTFALPKKDIEKLIPECLELDTLNNEWGFLAVAMVKTKNLRPKGFPKFFGNDFFLIGYRVFVKYTNSKGKKMRGLYILKSETDKLKMELFGNIFTHYNYSTTDILLHSKSNITEISSVKSNFKIQIDQTLTSENVKLPTHSPFSDWKEARKFAGPLPFTFTYNKNKKEVLIIEGVREDWKPNPVYVSNYYVSFLKSLNLEHAILANAFIVNKIPYSWKKGKKEKWEA